MLNKYYIPLKPFPEFKWKWASVQCTEGLNDPVVLLGVLFRMRKLEGKGYKYNSPEFAKELKELSNDVSDSVHVDLSRRIGARNLIRNSGQYWKAVGLIPQGKASGRIELTDFGRKVADREISQTEFSAITIQTFRLPNPQIQNTEECKQWIHAGLSIYPLRLILNIECELAKSNEAFLTTDELIKIIIPLSGCKANIQDYINFILWNRHKEISLERWPNCCPDANDSRIAREYLLFLSNYGYLNAVTTGKKRLEEQYFLNLAVKDEIEEILKGNTNDQTIVTSLNEIRNNEIASEFERNYVIASHIITRPNQANFRKLVLGACKRCIITNVSMPEVLEAAHIKPFKYKGEDTVANGFAMRTDIHTLFDTGDLRISVDGVVELSNRARMNYGALIPPIINIPSFTNKEFLRWRWDNYNGL